METNEYYSVLQKWLTGTATEEEDQKIQQWLAYDKENKRELEEIRSTWRESESGVDGISDEQFNVGLVKLEREVTNSIVKERVLKRTRNVAGLFLVANIILTCVAIYLFTSDRDKFYRHQDDSIHVDGKTLTLADGSTVNIKKGQLTSHYIDTARTVRMRGQVFFNVKKDDRPFIVVLDHGTIRVKGTAFMVETTPRGFDVFVKEGIVHVYYEKKQWKVRQGKHLKVVEGSFPMISQNREVNFDSWYTRKLQFKNASLQEVATALEKHYDIQCKLQPGLATCKFTGTFNDVPLSEAIRVLCYSMDIEFKIDRDGIYEIIGPPCHT